MIEQILVSVVVPVYKVEQYLDECIQSILRQTYACFELILVDDGSPDQCGQICERYAQKDDRIQVLHKKNGGLSDARNHGIELAKGKYITFIDSDDAISPYYLEIMTDCIIKTGSDIVQGQHSRDKMKLAADTGYTTYSFTEPDDILDDYLRFGKLYAYAWNKLYDIRLFKELRYPFGKIQEDAWTTYKAFLCSDKITVIDACTYFYRYNPESIMKGRFNPKRFEILQVPEDIQKFLELQGFGEKYQELLAYYKMRLGIKTYNDCLESGLSHEMQAQMKELRNLLIKLKPSKTIWQKKHIVLVNVLRISPKLYGMVVRYLR